MANLNEYAGAAIGKSFGSEAGSKPISAVDAADYAMERARELAGRIQVLADRMLGPQPPTPTISQGISANVECMGVLPILQASSERTSSAIIDGFNAISRIERSLP